MVCLTQAAAAGTVAPVLLSLRRRQRFHFSRLAETAAVNRRGLRGPTPRSRAKADGEAFHQNA